MNMKVVVQLRLQGSDDSKKYYTKFLSYKLDKILTRENRLVFLALLIFRSMIILPGFPSL